MTKSNRSLFKAAALGLGLTVAALAPPSLAQAAAPANPCDVMVQSRTAGTMEVAVTPASPAAAASGQIVWQPVASGPGVVLWVFYPVSALNRLGEPSGVMIVFHPKEQSVPAAMSVQVRSPNGRSWRFSGTAIAFAKDQARVAFGEEFPYGRGVLSAIADGQTLTIAVQQDDQTLMQESFAMSNIDSRDSLLAQARTKFVGAGCQAAH